MSAWPLACLQTAGHGANEGRNGTANDSSPPQKEKRKEKKTKTQHPETPKVYVLAAELRLILHRPLDRHQMVRRFNC